MSRSYPQSMIERAMHGFAGLFVLKLSDWVLNATTPYVITALKQGDIIFPHLMCIDVRTKLANGAGTATLSVGITGTVAKFIAASDIKTVEGAACAATGVGSAAAINDSMAPHIVTADTNLLANAVISNNGVTAGEVAIWYRIFRKADRTAIRV